MLRAIWFIIGSLFGACMMGCYMLSTVALSIIKRNNKDKNDEPKTSHTEK